MTGEKVTVAIATTGGEVTAVGANAGHEVTAIDTSAAVVGNNVTVDL